MLIFEENQWLTYCITAIGATVADKRYGPLPFTLSDLDAAYIAGIVDGEGCVTLSKLTDATMRDGHSYRPCVMISNTNRVLMQYLTAIVGVGRVNKRKPSSPNSKISYVWVCWSKQATSLLYQLLPFLVLKKKQAELLLDFQRKSSQNFGMRGLPPNIRRYQEKACHQMRRLNKRGK